MADGDITFTATVYKVQTLVDGGVRVTLDLPETAIMQMAQLAECQRFGVVLTVYCKTTEKQSDNAIQARTKRKSQRTPKEEKGVDSSIGNGTRPDDYTAGWDAD